MREEKAAMGRLRLGIPPHSYKLLCLSEVIFLRYLPQPTRDTKHRCGYLYQYWQYPHQARVLSPTRWFAGESERGGWGTAGVGDMGSAGSNGLGTAARGKRTWLNA